MAAVKNATGYQVDWEFYEGPVVGWSSMNSVSIAGNLAASYTFPFIGDQEGRWRVTALDNTGTYLSLTTQRLADILLHYRFHSANASPGFAPFGRSILPLPQGDDTGMGPGARRDRLHSRMAVLSGIGGGLVQLGYRSCERSRDYILYIRLHWRAAGQVARDRNRSCLRRRSGQQFSSQRMA